MTKSGKITPARGGPTLRVTPRPGNPRRGVLTIGAQSFPVALGRTGIRRDKREGDGATPAGRFRLVRLWWRPERGPRPATRLPIQRISPDLAWCEDPSDRRYNRPFRLRHGDAGDRLWRTDSLYDLVIELDHNTRPRVAHRGSAVFIHVARPGLSPTAGCVTLTAPALRRVLSRLRPGATIQIG